MQYRGATVDITQAKEHDALYTELQNEAASLDTIHEMLGSGKWTMDFDGEGVMEQVCWSDEFRRMLGYRWYRAVGKPTRRPDGSPISYVGVFIDITEQKEMMQQLAQQRESLSAALEEANQANKAKTAFLKRHVSILRRLGCQPSICSA